MIHWEKETTITNTYQMQFRLRVMETVGGTSQSYDATEEHVIRAIEESPELREAVDKRRIQWAQGLQKAYDEARRDQKDSEDRLCVALGLTDKIEMDFGAKGDEDAYATVKRLWSRLREAERERDFRHECQLREERELGAARERLVTIIDEAFGLQPVIEGTIDDVLTALERLLGEQGKRERAVLQQRDAAREEINQAWEAFGDLTGWTPAELHEAVAGTVAREARAMATIAKLERELAEARASRPQHIPPVSERDEAIVAKAVRDAQAGFTLRRIPSEADALELRSWRALAAWLRCTSCGDERQIRSNGRELISTGRSDMIAAYSRSTVVELARAMNLLGGEGAGEKGP